MTERGAVYIVDDDANLRSELADALAARGFAVREFADGAALIADHATYPPGCIVLDLNMPGVDGMEVQRTLAREGSAHKIVMLTGAGTISAAVAALHGGAVDFLEKPLRVDDLAAVVDRALQRQRHEQHERASRAAAIARLDRLSEREHDVFSGITLGLPNKIIAYRLGLSVRTVETYRANVMDKLGVRSLSDAVKLGLEAGHEPKGDIVRIG